MRQIIVEHGQSIVDIAIQEFGTADGLRSICDLNSLEYDDDLFPGQALLVPDLDSDNTVQTYMKSKRIQVNSHIDEGLIQVLATNENEIIGTNDNAAIQI